MHRFYCPSLPPLSACIELDADQSHHARRTLRLHEGDTISAFDGQGTVASAVIVRCDESAVTLQVSELTRQPAPRPELTLAVAFPKGPRADDMVNQLAQLGVARLIPLNTQRSVAEPGSGRRQRLARIAIEAAKQCGRAHLMATPGPMDLAQVLALPAELRLLAAPGGSAPRDFAQRLASAATILALIGPEGGWTDAECSQAQEAGSLPWMLGPHILRIEPAAVAAAAIVRYLTL